MSANIPTFDEVRRKYPPAPRPTLEQRVTDLERRLATLEGNTVMAAITSTSQATVMSRPRDTIGTLSHVQAFVAHHRGKGHDVEYTPRWTKSGVAFAGHYECVCGERISLIPGDTGD